MARGDRGIGKGNSDIKDNVFAKDWDSPLNADNPKDIFPSPKQGGVLEADRLGTPANPLGVANVNVGKGKK